MSLKLDLGSVGTFELSADGDLSKFLRPGLGGLAHFDSRLTDLLNSPVGSAPTGSVKSDFNFSFAPAWTLPQGVGITLSIQPEVSCKLSIIPPGGDLFTYYTGADATESPVKAPAGQYYVSIELYCALSLDAAASWSTGNFGVSGDISTNDQFRIANYYGIAPTVLLRDAISQAFSTFALPFHAETIAKLPKDDYLDFEFIGKLGLGFGATYGFSGIFFGGLSKGEVDASFATPVGKTVLSAAPSFQIGAGFKLNYSHEDVFRIVVGRTALGATLYLLRKDKSQTSTAETVGITLNAGVTFQTDASTMKSETQAVAQRTLGPTAGSLLGGKLGDLLDKAVGDVNDAVNSLLAKGDGHSIQLELLQSRSRENTALFIYDFDFSYGTGAYGVAMGGDYAKALAMPGVTLHPDSFVEQLYTRSAGVSLQFFNLWGAQDVTTYIQKTDITYLGSRVFQIRSTEGVQSISNIFGKERQADLFFIAQCKSIGETVSGVTVRLNVLFIDKNNASAFDESQRALKEIGLKNVADAVRSYVARYPKNSVQLTLDIDTESLTAIDSDEYLPSGKPPAEPHLKDRRNYEGFVKSVAQVVSPVDSVVSTFERYFSGYGD